MKRALIFLLLIAVFIFACGKSDSVKLEKDTAAYNFAVELAQKVPSLNPDENKVLVSSKSFDITTGEVIKLIFENSGNRANQLSTLTPDRITNIITSTAKGYGEQKLMLEAAREVKVNTTEQEVDSMLQIQFTRAGGEEKFMDWLSKSNIALEKVRKDLHDRITINHYFDKILDSEVTITDEELKKSYEQDKTASVRHILLMTQGKTDAQKKEIRKKIEGILKRARSGEDFAALAKQYSEDPGSKNKGGLYENFGRGHMVKPFEDAAFSVPIGEISDIVETQYGFHILKIVDRKKEDRPFEEVRKQLEEKFKRDKSQTIRTDHLNKLREEAEFKVLEL